MGASFASGMHRPKVKTNTNCMQNYHHESSTIYTHNLPNTNHQAWFNYHSIHESSTATLQSAMLQISDLTTLCFSPRNIFKTFVFLRWSCLGRHVKARGSDTTTDLWQQFVRELLCLFLSSALNFPSGKNRSWLWKWLMQRIKEKCYQTKNNYE